MARGVGQHCLNMSATKGLLVKRAAVLPSGGSTAGQRPGTAQLPSRHLLSQVSTVGGASPQKGASPVTGGQSVRVRHLRPRRGPVWGPHRKPHIRRSLLP